MVSNHFLAESAGNAPKMKNFESVYSMPAQEFRTLSAPICPSSLVHIEDELRRLFVPNFFQTVKERLDRCI
jgi:hypothetical protein